MDRPDSFELTTVLSSSLKPFSTGSVQTKSQSLYLGPGCLAVPQSQELWRELQEPEWLDRQLLYTVLQPYSP